MVTFKIKPQAQENVKAEAAALFIFEKSRLGADLKRLDKKLGGTISALIRKKKFTAKKESVRAIETLGKLKWETLLLVGLGREKDLTPETIRRVSAKAAKTLNSLGAANFVMSVDGLTTKKLDAKSAAQAAAEGIALSLYKFTEYKKKKDNNNADGIKTVYFAQKKAIAKVKEGVNAAIKIARGVYLARDLQNHPSNRMTPIIMGQRARAACAKAGVRCRVLGEKEIERLKMGALLSVAAGSAQPPRFIIMEHMKGKRSEKPIVLVGKGITFDTGGISIKPSSGMEEMKFDMSGGAAVIGAMYAVGLLKIKKNIVGLVPAAENMPGGRATRPGDIVKSMSGITVEIINTDAEGRLVLADGLNYAKKYKPKAVIDLATLTGAIMIALGAEASGLFGTDQKLIDALRQSGERTGERCWQMPLWDEYDEQIKSTYADVKNIGERYGGAITAAAFLKKFTDYPWAHIDIAGTAFSSRKKPLEYVTKGGSGFGVRQLIDFLQSGF